MDLSDWKVTEKSITTLDDKDRVRIKVAIVTENLTDEDRTALNLPTDKEKDKVKELPWEAEIDIPKLEADNAQRKQARILFAQGNLLRRIAEALF